MVTKSRKLSKKDQAAEAAFNRMSPGYDPGKDAIGVEFGLPFPKTSIRAWGFRAIKERGGFSLLHDRQSDWPRIAGSDSWTQEQKTFLKFIDSDVLQPLRTYAEGLDSNDYRYYHFKFDFAGTTCRAVITPRGSCGYIYGVVYVEPK